MNIHDIRHLLWCHNLYRMTFYSVTRCFLQSLRKTKLQHNMYWRQSYSAMRCYLPAHWFIAQNTFAERVKYLLNIRKSNTNYILLAVITNCSKMNLAPHAKFILEHTNACCICMSASGQHLLIVTKYFFARNACGFVWLQEYIQRCWAQPARLVST